METTGRVKSFRRRRVRLMQCGLLAVLAGFCLARAESAANDGTAKPIVISGAAIRDAVRFRVEPEYPPIARQFGVTGEVVAEFTVGLNGKVESVQVTKGSPLLSAAVVSALKKWTFVPFDVDGHPTKVKSTLSFVFKL